MAEASNEQRRMGLIPVVVFVVTFVGCLYVHRPSRYYFFGDSWGALYGLLVDWKNVLQPHNEHLMPVFKGLYLLEYKLFGANHFLYMMVGFALHAANATLVYLLGRRLSLRPWPSVAAAIIFAFSWVHWEVTGWSFEQCFMLSTLFMLIVVILFCENPHRNRTLLWVGILSLAAYWSAAVSLALLPILFAFYVLWLASRSEPVERAQVLKTFLAMGLPFVVYLASLRATMSFSTVLAMNKTHLSLFNLPTVIDLTLFSAAYGLVLPTLTFINPQSLASAPLILLLVLLFLVLSYRRLEPELQHRAFRFLLCFLLLPLVVVSLGRIQWGPAHMLSSHYQYLPLVGFALLVALCGQALRDTLQQQRTQIWFNVAAVVLLAYYVDYHVHLIRRVNPAAYRGMQTQYFLQTARRATYPSSVPAGGAVLGPELSVPDFVHAPGSFPLWQVFQILDGNRRSVVPVGDYLRSQDATLAGNLIRNGGFEEPSQVSSWKGDGGARLERTDSAAHAGRYSAAIISPGNGSALSQDVIQSCPAPLSGKILTFSVQAKTQRAEALQASLIFKDRGNNVVGESRSRWHPGGDEWSPLVVSGLAPENTCIVAVSVVNPTSAEITGLVDDAILLAHPAALDREGKLLSPTLEAIVPSRSGQAPPRVNVQAVEGRSSHGK